MLGISPEREGMNQMDSPHHPKIPCSTPLSQHGIFPKQLSSLLSSISSFKASPIGLIIPVKQNTCTLSIQCVFTVRKTKFFSWRWLCRNYIHCAIGKFILVCLLTYVHPQTPTHNLFLPKVDTNPSVDCICIDCVSANVILAKHLSLHFLGVVYVTVWLENEILAMLWLLSCPQPLQVQR